MVRRQVAADGDAVPVPRPDEEVHDLPRVRGHERAGRRAERPDGAAAPKEVRGVAERREARQRVLPKDTNESY